ncbi:MAG: phospholipid carrier-dependent glycosyltransferase [Kiritimatiellaeota bacterium]|nr:phospholipid carrier-dependent glycosyltransferase [Kiritimatiellota bacterium]
MWNSIFSKYGKLNLILLLFILVVASLLRFPAYRFGYPLATHPDEPHYNIAAASILDTGTSEGWAMVGYPPGIIYTNILFLKLFHKRGELAYSVVPYVRLAAIFFSILTILLMFLIGHHIGFPQAGILSAFLWTVTPIAVEYARYATAEPFMMFFLMLTIFLLVLNFKRGSEFLRYSSYLISLVVILFKYQAILVLIPVFSCDLYHLWQRRRDKKLFQNHIKHMAIRCVSLIAFFAWLQFGYEAFHTDTYTPDWCWRRHTKLMFPGFRTVGGKMMMFLDTLAAPKEESPYSMDSPNPASYLLPILSGLMVFVGLTGYFTDNKRDSTPFVSTSLLFLLIWSIALSFFNSHYRHMIPVVPLFYIIASIGIINFYRMIFRFSKQYTPKCCKYIFISTILPVICLIYSQMVLPATHNMLEKSKPDIRNAINSWADNTVKGGTFTATQACSTIFMPYAGFKGTRPFKCAYVINGRELDIKNLYSADYTIMPIALYEKIIKKSPRVKEDLLPLKRFIKGEKYYGDDYIFLANRKIDNIVNEKLKCGLKVLGYSQHIEKRENATSVELTLFWKANTPTLSPKQAVVIVKKENALINAIAFSPLPGSRNSRGSDCWTDSEEIFISDKTVLVFGGKGKYVISTGFIDATLEKANMENIPVVDLTTLTIE